MTKVYFVRHAQSEHAWNEDRTRPLTEEGKKDSAIVSDFLKDKKIDVFYCSPYKRSIDTIADAAAFFGKKIITDERLREREKGQDGNNHGMFRKRWENHDYHEYGGESISMVQNRNIEALNMILIMLLVIICLNIEKWETFRRIKILKEIKMYVKGSEAERVNESGKKGFYCNFVYSGFYYSTVDCF